MNSNNRTFAPPEIRVEQMESLNAADLNDLCDAAEAAILDGGGFGWLLPPEHDVLEAYWGGVILSEDLFYR